MNKISFFFVVTGPVLISISYVPNFWASIFIGLGVGFMIAACLEMFLPDKVTEEPKTNKENVAK